jgi:Polyketide cyclase / dehydrase and lipid transport
VLTYDARSAASPEVAWSLMAEPDRWHEWAPHVRGARGLGTPEVEPGARGTVRLMSVVLIPAEITGKHPGRSWCWRVGPMSFVHRVEPALDGGLGCRAAVDMNAPWALERALAVSYGPLVALLVRNLARVAGRTPA